MLGLPLADSGHIAVQKRRVGVQWREAAVHQAVVAKAGAGAWSVDPTRTERVLRSQPQAASDRKENRAQTTADHRAFVRTVFFAHRYLAKFLVCNT